MGAVACQSGSANGGKAHRVGESSELAHGTAQVWLGTAAFGVRQARINSHTNLSPSEDERAPSLGYPDAAEGVDAKLSLMRTGRRGGSNSR